MTRSIGQITLKYKSSIKIFHQQDPADSARPTSILLIILLPTSGTLSRSLLESTASPNLGHSTCHHIHVYEQGFLDLAHIVLDLFAKLDVARRDDLAEDDLWSVIIARNDAPDQHGELNQPEQRDVCGEEGREKEVSNVQQTYTLINVYFNPVYIFIFYSWQSSTPSSSVVPPCSSGRLLWDRSRLGIGWREGNKSAQPQSSRKPESGERIPNQSKSFWEKTSTK